MVALLVGMAVAAVYMATMLPAWRQQVVREQETDLAGRGEQYARAIALYYRNNNCTLPRDIDQLVFDHYLRKKWQDPITQADFQLVMAGAAAASSPTNGQNGQPTGSGAPARGNTPSGGAPQPGRGAPQSGGGSTLSGILGVQSTSTATSIRIYNSQQQYNLWVFNLQTGLQSLQKSGVTVQCGSGANGAPANGPARGTGNGAQRGTGNGPPTGGPRGGPADRRGPGGANGNERGSGFQGPPPPGIGTGRGRGSD